MASDRFSGYARSVTASLTRGAKVTPSDSAELGFVSRGVQIGDAGDVCVIFTDGSEVTLKGLIVGALYPYRIKQVKATGTTATEIYVFD